MAGNDKQDLAAIMEAEARAESKPEPESSKAAESVPEPQPTVERHEAVYDISVDVIAVLGRADLPVSQILKLGRGAVVELNRKTEEDIELFVNDTLVAIGEIITIGDALGVKINKIVKSNYTKS